MKHIFSKIAKIGEEVRSAEPMKVELASSMLASLLAGLKAQDENLRQQADLLTKYTSDLQILKSKTDEQIRVANSTISNAEAVIDEAQKAKNEIRQQASELGVNVNDIPMYKELLDREQKIKSNLERTQELNLKLLQAF
jgi:hypothetical protein